MLSAKVLGPSTGACLHCSTPHRALTAKRRQGQTVADASWASSANWANSFQASLGALTSMASPGAAFTGRSPQELKEWLEAHGVSCAAWGTGQAKTVGDLYQEVEQQESQLVLDATGRQPLRMLQVLSMYVTNNQGKVLMEAQQRLPDGRVRVRRLPLSEKLMGSESWRDGAVRAVREELGSILPGEPQVTLYPSSYTKNVELFISNSYPALRTQYTCHRVAGEVAGLPAGPFETREPRPGGELVSSWVWEDRDAVLDGCSNKSIG